MRVSCPQSASSERSKRVLRPELLNDGFNDQLRPGDGSPKVGARGDRGERRVDPGAFQAAQRRQSLQVGPDVCQCGPKPIIAQVVESNLVARQGKLLGDAVAHQAGTDDRDALDLRMIHAVPFASRDDARDAYSE